MITVLIVLSLFLALYFCASGTVNIVWKWIITLLFLVFLIGLGVYFIANSFTSVGVDESVIYHLKSGLDKASVLSFPKLIVAGFAYFIFIIAFLVIVFDLLGNRRFRISNVLSRAVKKSKRNPPLLASFCLVLAIILSPLSRNIWDLSKSTPSDFGSSVTSNKFVIPETFEIKDPKNLVFIYMEGLERTFLNSELYPNLAPNLKSIDQDNQSFNNLHQVYSTTYTMGGLVASQCGVPLYAPNNINGMERIDKFLPNLLCMGDILKTNGYELNFIGGAKLSFAGKGKFLSSHGFDSVLGRRDHLRDVKDPDSYNVWGLHDDVLLDKAYDIFSKKVNQERPFAQFILTVDTHIPKGFESQECQKNELIYEDSSDGLLNAVKCTDYIVSEFIEKIQNSPAGENTLIVLASDHLMMKSSVSQKLSSVPRRNYFVVLDPNSKKSRKIARPASTLDIAPTVLSYLGLNLDGLGFGRNLMSPNTTLIELYPDKYNAYLKAMSAELISTLWDYPQLDAGFRIDTKEKKLFIANEDLTDRWVELPVLLTFKTDNKIDNILFDHPQSRKRRDYMGRHVPKKQSYLWIDYCDVIERKLHNPDTPIPDETKWCTSYRAEIDGNHEINTVTNDATMIGFDDLVSPK